MTTTPNNNSEVTKRSTQYIKNLGFDEDFNVSAVELLGHDSDNDVLRRVQVDENGAVKTSGGSGLPVATFASLKRYGFTNLTDTSISFNDSTYVFTLTGTSWSYFRDGTLYTISGNKTVTLPGTPPTKGLYYIYIDATDGTLTQSTSAWTLLDTKVPVATVLWDNTLTPKYYLMDERHTCLIDRRMHYMEHSTEGTRLISGGVPSGQTANTDSDAAICCGVPETVIADEDLITTLPALTDPNGSSTAYTVFYRTNSTTWNWEASYTPFRYTNNGYIQYDSSGTMTEGTTAKFYTSYLLYTNLTNAGFIFINGRSEFASQAAAEAENPATWTWTGIPINEFVIGYQFVWSGNAGNSSKGKVQLKSTKKLNTSFAQTAVNATADHNSLAGLQGGSSTERYHLTSAQSALVDNSAQKASTFSTNAFTYVDADGKLGTGSTLSTSNGLVTCGGTLRIPNGQGPTLGTSAGCIAWDTQEEALQIYDDGAFVVATKTHSIFFTVMSPVVADEIPIATIPRAITITKVQSTTYGADTTFNFNINERDATSIETGGTAITNAAITADHDGTATTSFSNASIDAGDHLVFLGAAGGSGTPTAITIRIDFTIDPTIV